MADLGSRDAPPPSTGTFHAAGCVSFRPGAFDAVGDSNPVPERARRPPPKENVPERARRPPPKENVPGRAGPRLSSDAARRQHAVDRAQLLQDLGLDLTLDVDQRHRQLAA